MDANTPIINYVGCSSSDTYTSEDHFLLIINHTTGIRTIFNQPLPDDLQAFSIQKLETDFCQNNTCTIIMAPYTSEDKGEYKDDVNWARQLKWRTQTITASMQTFYPYIAFYQHNATEEINGIRIQDVKNYTEARKEAPHNDDNDDNDDNDNDDNENDDDIDANESDDGARGVLTHSAITYVGCKAGDNYQLDNYFLLIVDTETGIRAIINQSFLMNIAARRYTLQKLAEDFCENRPSTIIMAPYERLDSDDTIDKKDQEHIAWARQLKACGAISTSSMQTIDNFQSRMLFYNNNMQISNVWLDSDNDYQRAIKQYKRIVAPVSGSATPVPVPVPETTGSVPATTPTLLSSAKLKHTQIALDVFVASLFGAIGISVIFMSPVGAPFIVASSVLLAGIIGAFSIGMGRFVNDSKNLTGLQRASHILHMVLTGGGVVMVALALCHACGMFALSPALSISLLFVMAAAMVGAAVINIITTQKKQIRCLNLITCINK
jgi:hypothetical protein